MLGPTARAFGQGGKWTCGGVELEVVGRLQECYPKIEAEFRSRRYCPMDNYFANCGRFPDGPARDRFLQLSIEAGEAMQALAGQQILEWITSMDGGPYYMSLTMREAGQALTEARARELLVKELESMLLEWVAKADSQQAAGEAMADRALDQVMRAMLGKVDEASGSDLLGKETGPPSAKGGPKATSRSPRGTFLGRAFSAVFGRHGGSPRTRS